MTLFSHESSILVDRRLNLYSYYVLSMLLLIAPPSMAFIPSTSAPFAGTGNNRVLEVPHNNNNNNNPCYPNPNNRCIGRSYTSTIQRYVAGADVEQDTDSDPAVAEAGAAPSRGKVNEIDFCIAPADVSLSRSYSQAKSDNESSTTTSATTTKILVNPAETAASSSSPPVLSLTRALNNASNRVVRRILLARAWPSAEALNKSFRQAALAEKQRAAASLQSPPEGTKDDAGSNSGGAKCPIPRPILNLLVRRRADKKYPGNSKNDNKFDASPPKSRTDEEYVTDQLNNFRERYGNLPGYSFAEAYLESILSLATSGKESPRVQEVSKRFFYCCEHLYYGYSCVAFL